MGAPKTRTVNKATPVHMIPKVWAQPRLLVVAPSRELAAQIHRVVTDLLEPFPELNCTLLIGGANHARQDESLKYRLPAVVVGTPGRIMDHATEGRLDLNKLKSVVLDEIDMLLKVSRQDHLRLLVNALPPPSRAQRVLVSATGQCCDEAEEFAAEQLRAPWRSIGPRNEVEMPPRVLHLANGAPDVDKKMRFLRRLSTSNPMPNGVLVFCNNFERARKVAESLRYNDIPAEVLSGNRSKESREKAIKNMESGKIDMLVATDVATRGLDFRDVTHVVNFELPPDANTYAHRAGRCGRMGRNGIVISLGGGGASNHRLQKYMSTLQVDILEANVQSGELCIQTHKLSKRVGAR
uniref:RNA helicase n=1 Tax=Alexandrium andersonii TaxID=327968 RepID=A0A7S2B195_9DINO